MVHVMLDICGLDTLTRGRGMGSHEARALCGWRDERDAIVKTTSRSTGHSAGVICSNTRSVPGGGLDEAAERLDAREDAVASDRELILD
jgi:hypothetical protein